MSKIEKIEKEVRGLTVEELATFRKWFAEFDSKAWDNQIEKDANGETGQARSEGVKRSPQRKIVCPLKHHASRDFWDCYRALPQNIQDLAIKKFELLKENPHHPSLHFKKIESYFSARVGLSHRVLAGCDV